MSEPTYEELAAQVEVLRNAGSEVYAELQQWALTENHEETNRVFRLWLNVRNQTPASCLAQVRADAVEQFKDELLRATSIMFRAHIEGVYAVVEGRIRQGVV